MIPPFPGSNPGPQPENELLILQYYINFCQGEFRPTLRPFSAFDADQFSAETFSRVVSPEVGANISTRHLEVGVFTPFRRHNAV